jgi:hypothetical protein
MPRACTICQHPAREAINQDLVSGVSFRIVAERYNASPAAVFRHNQSHLSKPLFRAHSVQDLREADDLLAKVAALEADAKRLQGLAEDAGDLKTALQGVRELVRIVELQAKLVGDIESSPTVNILVTAEWTALRSVLSSCVTDDSSVLTMGFFTVAML